MLTLFMIVKNWKRYVKDTRDIAIQDFDTYLVLLIENCQFTNLYVKYSVDM